MSVPRDLLREHPGLGKWAILHGYRGSIAHGTFVPSSDPLSIDDKDTMAVCVPPPDYYTGLRQFGSRGTQEIVRDEWDVVVYEVRKAIGLLTKGNPNVLSLLWLPEHLWIKRTPAGRLLLDSRHLFVGKHVYKAFAGYASAQLQKMERGVYKGYMGDKRLSTLQTGNPEELYALAVLPGGAERERDLHRRFAEGRVKGEWFRYETAGLAAFISEAIQAEALAAVTSSPGWS